jgi:hypothetical protein
MVSFAGRFDPREHLSSAGERRITLEIDGVAIEYGPKPREVEPATKPIADRARRVPPGCSRYPARTARAPKRDDHARPAGAPKGAPRVARRTASGRRI